jgi:homoserine kinase
MRSGALGFSLSGSGPSLFALCENGKAENLATAMEQACRAQGIQCESWVSPMNAPGAHLVD